MNRIAVALSGGLDSVVLLDTACKASDPAQTEIWVFHIHHGLQAAANDWLMFCQRLAKQYRVHFDFRLLQLCDDRALGNIEARARVGRYEALAELCAEHAIENLLLAHHQNDQAETVLLQLLRGSGVAGLAGMPLQRDYVKGNQPLTLWRPLLNQSRADLEAYAKIHKLQWIEDPSNQDERYRRNAIRKAILPRLAKIQPEAIANLARSAQVLGESQGLLDRLAQQDGKAVLKEGAVLLPGLMTLKRRDTPAANNLLRYWLKTHGLSMPSQERLDAWWRDLEGVRPDASLEWQHDGACIRLWRSALQLAPTPQGCWTFRAVPTRSQEPGIARQSLLRAQKNGSVEYRERQGAEKLQIKANAPRRTLKNLYQESKVPPWERNAPLLYLDGELIAVAGVGVSYPHLTTSGARVWPEWSQQNPVQ